MWHYGAQWIIAGLYIDAIIRFQAFSEFDNFSISKDLEIEEFSKLVIEATKNGIKRTATENGFYNKQLAIELSKGVLYNRLLELLKSNKSYEYKIIHIVDTYRTFRFLATTYYYEGGRKETGVDYILEAMFKKYPNR